MTTGKTNLVKVEQPPAPAAGSCKWGKGKRKHRRGRKFRRACCCISFLLLLNSMLLLHTSHSVGAIMWFMLNGSVTYKEDTFLFVPGGAKTFCNDFCVNMCIYGDVDCQLASCLNSCNNKLENDGNDSEFEELPVSESEDEGDFMIIDFVEDEEDDGVDVDGMMEDQNPEGFLNQILLNQMQSDIEGAVSQLKEARATYEEMCGEDASQFGCNLRKEALLELIEGVKEQMNAYDAYAISFGVDIRVQVWMVDMDEVTAEP